MTAFPTQPTTSPTLIIGVQTPNNPLPDIQSYWQEFRNLVASSGRTYSDELFIKLRSIDPATFFTKGKLAEIHKLCLEKDIKEVIISEPLSVMQERNLARDLQCEIVDRTLLILEIFERGAVSAEGKKQVALARLSYEKSRLAGYGGMLSQQAGTIGVRGPGETQKEKETQHIERLMGKLKKDLEHLEKIRQTQRKRRIESVLPLLCLVGYTNAGKSTILNALTKSNIIAENKLFSTLDTTTRELYIDGKKLALISDTVGFIQYLPHHLVNAFKSTLTELQYAHLLLHIIDVSDPNWRQHCVVVLSVLADLGIDKPMLYVFNKIDKVTLTPELQAALAQYKPHVTVSAVTPGGLDPLVDFLRSWLA
jgi:GTPase